MRLLPAHAHEDVARQASVGKAKGLHEAAASQASSSSEFASMHTANVTQSFGISLCGSQHCQKKVI